jgi:hypothetical protein
VSTQKSVRKVQIQMDDDKWLEIKVYATRTRKNLHTVLGEILERAADDLPKVAPRRSR